MTEEGRKQAYENLIKENVDALVVIGGDGSFTGALVFNKEFGIPVMGIPGTIDNDINGTDFTIGFDTALNTVISSIDKIRDTASSHHRVFFVEVMGKDAGSLAIDSALGSAIATVLIPEEQTDIFKLVEQIKSNRKNKKAQTVLLGLFL